MGCIVVGRQRSDVSNDLLRFAATEARLRGRSVQLTHVWDLPVEIAVELQARDDIDVSITACAVPGPVAPALLAQDPELLVLGAHTATSNRLSHVLRAVLHHVSCPVVVVPAENPAPVERVVVGVSATSTSIAAARWAADEARRHGAELVVAHGWQLEPHGWRELTRPTTAIAAQQRDAEVRLRRWMHDALPGIEAATRVARGGPLDVMLAASTPSDMLVVGYSPHERLSRMLHGRIADDLVVRSGCSVTVVPA